MNPIQSQSTYFRMATVFVFLLFAACGGGSGGGTPAVSGSDARSFGEIERLGSIVVNGVRYEVEGAQIIGLDHPQELLPGMVVKVDGRVDGSGLTGKAEQIAFESRVQGPLEVVTVDAAVQVNTIMGQTVVFEDNLTKFDAATGMPLGDDLNKVFQVSGFADENGAIQATFARKMGDDDFAQFLAQGGFFEVKGTVSGLNAAAQTFMINDLTIDYSAAAMRDLPAGGLSDGLPVEVKGNAFDPDAGILTAMDIEGKVSGLGDDTPRAQVQGFIAELNAGAETFSLNGQGVDYSDAAFRAGIEEDLADGVKVEAQGPLVNGVIQATRVTFKESVRIEADMQSQSGGALTFQGLSGLTIIIHPELTRGAEAMGAVNAGNQVKVRARQAAAGLIATRLEKIDEDPGDRTVIQGPVTAFNAAAGSVTILGTVAVDTATIANEDFKEHDDVIGRAAFFAGLQVGDIVKARSRSGRWDQIEIQD